jgi:endonuclease III-like uncharacterized protein
LADKDEWGYVSIHLQKERLDKWIYANEPWRNKELSIKKVITQTPKPIIEPIVKQEWDYMKLVNIKGIGVETVKDIGKNFDSENHLIQDLKDDKVGLRNDIVKLLKSYYQLNIREVNK